MKAALQTYRQSPRKVRLIADMIRGKRVMVAETLLKHADKRAAGPMFKLLRSAVANARSLTGRSGESLTIKRITVDKGATLYRYMPRARGRGAPIRKRTSHITIELGEA